MNSLSKLLIATVLLLFATDAAWSSGNVQFGGQVRPRFEFRDMGSGTSDSFNSMRVRAHVLAELDRNVDVFIQMQDVRLWGEESSTLTDARADNFDMHQGYVLARDINGSPISLQAGRQEISQGNQRLIGAVNWSQQGRAFDGVKATIAPENVKIDAFGIKLAENSAAGAPDNAYLYGAFGTIHNVPNGSVDLWALNNTESGPATGPTDTNQWTAGGAWNGRNGSWSHGAEGAFQTGTRAGTDVAAWMASAHVGKSFADGRAKLTAWWDMLSGDDDPADSEIKVFDTLFATNHQFYGFADLFTDLPLHTGGLGLQDIALKTWFNATPDLGFGVDVHSFHVVESATLDSGHLGEEVDVTMEYGYSTNLSIVGGLSHVIADDAWGVTGIGMLMDDQTFGYVMTNASF